eukprot:4854635-Amphidinium_carterae.2
MQPGTRFIAPNVSRSGYDGAKSMPRSSQSLELRKQTLCQRSWRIEAFLFKIAPENVDEIGVPLVLSQVEPCRSTQLALDASLSSAQSR